MRAAVIGADGSFALADHEAPGAAAGSRLIEVRAAGIGPTEPLWSRFRSRASQLGPRLWSD